MPITAASDAAANELDRGDYIKLLAEGTGLSSEQVEATNTAWAGLELSLNTQGQRQTRGLL